MSEHESTRARPASERPERPTVTAFGGDWDELLKNVAEHPEDRLIVNMGPQHPSTHGVLRLILELDGEQVTECRCGIGYLHTGIEKNMEFRNWTQGVTYVTRADYLMPVFNEVVYCLAVERLLDATSRRCPPPSREACSPTSSPSSPPWTPSSAGPTADRAVRRTAAG